MIHADRRQYHIMAAPGEVGGYCLLPGDPGRCEKIAAYLDNPYHLVQNREFNLWCGTLLGDRVTVCSTGIGGPSAAIAADLLIACGAVRQDGTSHEYAPPEFPAVPDCEVLFALREAAKNLGYPAHTGVVQSKDSFYGQHSPGRMATSAALLEKWEAWKRLGVLASEMEAAALFTVGATLRLATGAVFLTVWNQERVNLGLDSDADEVHDTDSAIRTAIEAIKILIVRKDGERR